MVLVLLDGGFIIFWVNELVGSVLVVVFELVGVEVLGLDVLFIVLELLFVFSVEMER